MSKAKSAVKIVVAGESKTLGQEMDGVRRAIEGGVVDVQTITVLKRLLLQKNATAAVASAATKRTTTSLSSARSKTKQTTSVVSEEPFPSTILVSNTKTLVMCSLTTLTTEIESRAKPSSSENTDSTSTKTAKIAIPQGMKNVMTCCKLALEALRQWQDHKDIGVSWVNKACLGYINKLTALEMV
jgi:hypothetical protein